MTIIEELREVDEQAAGFVSAFLDKAVLEATVNAPETEGPLAASVLLAIHDFAKALGLGEIVPNREHWEELAAEYDSDMTIVERMACRMPALNAILHQGCAQVAVISLVIKLKGASDELTNALLDASTDFMQKGLGLPEVTQEEIDEFHATPGATEAALGQVFNTAFGKG